MAERNPSKQRRAAQNKANRQALAARRAKASEIRETAGEPAAEAPKRRRSRFSPAPAKTETGRPSRSAPARPARSGRSADTTPAAGRSAPTRDAGPDQPTEPGYRGFLAHLQQIAGGKAVLFAAIFSLVAAAMLLFASVVPRGVVEAPAQIVEAVQRDRGVKFEEHEILTDTKPITTVFGPIGVLFAAVPVVISGAALAAAARPNRRRNFTIAAFALGLYVVFFTGFGIFYFFSMAGLFFAAYQARKADPPVPRARARKDDDDTEDELEDEDDDET